VKYALVMAGHLIYQVHARETLEIISVVFMARLVHIFVADVVQGG
jgi:hypothetical protein